MRVWPVLREDIGDSGDAGASSIIGPWKQAATWPGRLLMIRHGAGTRAATPLSYGGLGFRSKFTVLPMLSFFSDPQNSVQLVEFNATLARLNPE
jgi:hypothetical protein